MSAKADGICPPTQVLQQAVHGGESGIIVETKQYRGYMLYLNGWFMWQGVMYDMIGKSLGAGLTRINAKRRYPLPTPDLS